MYFLSYELEFSDKSCHIVFFYPVCELGTTVSILQMNKSRISEISTNLLQVIPQYLVKKKDEDEKEKYQQLLIEFQANAFFYIVLCRE